VLIIIAFLIAFGLYCAIVHIMRKSDREDGVVFGDAATNNIKEDKFRRE
jgi:hypothetical protein